MRNPFADTNIQIIGGILIIGIAVTLGLTGAKLPAKNVSLTQNSNTMTSTHSPYQFPGRLPDDQLLNTQVRMTTSKGEIVLAMDPDQAPIATSNFLYLVGEGFYDGIIIHRVDPGFVIQAGDPQTKDASVDPIRWGTGGPGYQFADEPVTGEYTAGTLAMANAGPNTNGSQFFIMLEDRLDLPKAYTIFGQVTAGMEVVRSLVKGDTIEQAVVESAS